MILRNLKALCFTLLGMWLGLGGNLDAQIQLVRIDGSSSSSTSVQVEDEMVVTTDGKVDINEYRLIDFGKAIGNSDAKASVSLVGGGAVGCNFSRTAG